MKKFISFIAFEGSILIGLFYLVTIIVTLINQYTSTSFKAKLSNKTLGFGNFHAAILGAITPFCSCSTVPILSGMIQANIRFGICITFLMASPLVNEVVIVIMLRLFNISYTISFVLLSLLIPIIAGILMDISGFSKYLRNSNLTVNEIPGFIETKEIPTIVPFKAKLKFASLISFYELRESFPYIIIGLLIGGIIYGFIPSNWIIIIGEKIDPLHQIIIMAILGTPLYFNMIAALPIAFALIDRGLGIGPITAFLVAGSGTSIPEMILLLKLFKINLLLSYIAAVIFAAIFFGIYFTYIMN